MVWSMARAFWIGLVMVWSMARAFWIGLGMVWSMAKAFWIGLGMVWSMAEAFWIGWAMLFWVLLPFSSGLGMDWQASWAIGVGVGARFGKNAPRSRSRCAGLRGFSPLSMINNHQRYMFEKCQVIERSRWFQTSSVVAILFAGTMVGLETSPSLVAENATLFHILDVFIMGVFVAELLIKMAAQRFNLLKFFKDPWNIFDFTIVVSSFLPIGGHQVAVLRLIRLLRVLRLIKALPQMRLLVSALLKSIPSMSSIFLLIGLIFYVYGVAATFIFGANDPINFGTLTDSMITLFQVVTGDGWSDVMKIQMYGCAVKGYADNMELCTQSSAQPWVAVPFFVSFILLGTMIVLNLFIGVITNSMSEAREDRAREDAEDAAKTAAAAEHGLTAPAQPEVPASDHLTLTHLLHEIKLLRAEVQRLHNKTPDKPESPQDAA